MQSAIGSSIGIVAYLALFAGAGIAFLFINLLVGKFVRPADPHAEKLEIYECGEPTIGSSFVQFDLRFYVVALLFIIFDVEVAFFFPWATVFGKSVHLGSSRFVAVESAESGHSQLTEDAKNLYRELGVRNPTLSTQIPESLQKKVNPQLDDRAKANEIIRQGSHQLAFMTMIDIVVFFAVLMVGFAYVWKRGDLDWVRALTQEKSARYERELEDAAARETILSA